MPWPLLLGILNSVGGAAATAGSAIASGATTAAGALSSAPGLVGKALGDAVGLGPAAGGAGGGGAALGASGGASLAGQAGASSAGVLPGTATVLGVPGNATLATAGKSLLGGNLFQAAGDAGEALGAPDALNQGLREAGGYSFGPSSGGGGNQEGGELPQPLGSPLRRNSVASVFAGSRRYGGGR